MFDFLHLGFGEVVLLDVAAEVIDINNQDAEGALKDKVKMGGSPSEFGFIDEAAEQFSELEAVEVRPVRICIISRKVFGLAS